MTFNVMVMQVVDLIDNEPIIVEDMGGKQIGPFESCNEIYDSGIWDWDVMQLYYDTEKSYYVIRVFGFFD